jgi:hypothetical protein
MRRLFRDLWSFARQRRKWWLLPLLLICVLMAQLGWVLAHPVVAPFLYSLF